MRNGLPKGWTMAPLGEITQINPRHPKGLDDSMPVAFAPMAAISESKPKFQFLEERPLGKVRKGFTHFAEGDVLFAKITPCMENGKGAVAVGLRNGLGCGTTELHVLRPQERIDPYYLYRFLAQPSIRRIAKEKFTGTAGQARVPTSFIEQLEIPLPPLPEQRRIVAKLEKLLAEVDTCQQQLAKIPVLLKRFRQSVLAAACSGRLTADWREKNPTSEVESTDDGSECLMDLPRTWRWRKIGDLFTVETGTTPPKKQLTNYSTMPSACPFFKPTDLDASAYVLEAREWLSSQGEQRARPLPAMTVCVTSIGATIGKTGLLRVRGATNQQINSILPTEGVQSEFAFFYCCSPYFQRRIVEESSSTTLPIINKGRFEELEFPLPPLAEQQEIVRRVEALFALADQIETRCARAKTHADNLTQSILAKAFRGGLVSQQGCVVICDPTMQKLDRYLVYLRKNEAALFIGAGISRIAGCSGAKELCRVLQERMMELKKQQKLFGDAVSPRYIHSFSESTLSNQEYKAILDENLIPDPGKFSEKYLPFIKTLTRCDPLPPIMTINIDPCLKLTKLFEMRNIYSRMADMRLDKFKNKAIFHLHGYRDGEGSIVLNTIEHRERWGKPSFKRFIVDVFKNYSVLFLGCSLEDNVELLAQIELAKKENGLSSKVHFALMPVDDPVAIPDEIFDRLHGIQIIKYGARDSFTSIFGKWIDSNFPRPSIPILTGEGDSI